MPSSAILDESTEMLISTEESLTILGSELVHDEKEASVTWTTYCSFLYFLNSNNDIL